MFKKRSGRWGLKLLRNSERSLVMLFRQVPTDALASKSASQQPDTSHRLNRIKVMTVRD